MIPWVRISKPIIATATARASIMSPTACAVSINFFIDVLASSSLTDRSVIILTTATNAIDSPTNDINAPVNEGDILLIRAATAAIAPIVAIAIVRFVSILSNSSSLIVASKVIERANMPTAAASSSMASALVLSASALSRLLNWLTAPFTELRIPCTGSNLSASLLSCVVIVLVILRRNPALKSERTTPQLRLPNVCCIA